MSNKWIYKKDVNRMGEITQTLTNESIDPPILDSYQTPKLVIKKDRFGFGIKFHLGGLELKGGIKTKKYYVKNYLYDTYVEHKRFVDCGIVMYRFRFDENEVQKSFIDYFCKNESEFKIVSDFMFSLKESKKLIVELDTEHYGIQYYEFELEGLSELCDEYKIFQYKKPTPFEPYIPSANSNKFNIWWVIVVLFSICLMILYFANNSNNETAHIDNSTSKLDTAIIPGGWNDLSTMKKTKPKKQIRTKVHEETRTYSNKHNVVLQEEEPIYESNKVDEAVVISVSPKKLAMIKYLKERFPNYTEYEINQLIKDSYYDKPNENNHNENFHPLNYNESRRDEPMNTRYQTNEQPKRKSFIKRIFSKRDI